MNKKRVLLIASYDSFLNTGYAIAKEINYSTIDIYIHQTKKNILSESQLSLNGLSLKEINFFHIDDYFDKLMYQNYDIVILSLGNGLLTRFFRNSSKLNLTLPIVITLFPGVIFGDSESIITRLGANILLFNNYYDYQIGNKFKERYNLSCTNILYGYPILRKKHHCSDGNKVYFIDQVKIPDGKKERLLILKKLIALANRYPHKDLVLLLRVHQNDITVHEDKYSYAELAKNMKLPDNFKIERKRTQDALQEMGYCLSFSSTMLFEAESCGIPIGVISDLGVDKKYANTHFKDSGVLVNLDTVDLDSPNTINPTWAELYTNPDSLSSKEFNQLLEVTSTQPPSFDNYFIAVNDVQPVSMVLLRKFKKLIYHPKQFFVDSKLYKLIKFTK
ncbi:TPA: DUF6716 putative glycosyltransferase [Neisseria meningitidis]